MAEIKAPLYSSDGKAKGEVTLDPEVFGIEPNMAVLHQVVTAQMAGKRRGTHSTKTRGEVSGGGKKPWRQKGLGRARHGSIRAPQWVGGGIAHGPKPRDYSQRTPKKMKRLALRSALSARASEQAVKVIDGFDWTAPKTKQAVELFSKIGVSGKTLVIIERGETVANHSFRNLPQVRIAEPNHVTTYDVLWADDLVFTSGTVTAVGGKDAYAVSAGDFVKESGGEG